MEFLTRFLLISCLSIIIIPETKSFPSEREIEEIIEKGQLNIIGSSRTNLKLVKGGELCRKESVLVWKGTYNDNTDVGIKIFNIEDEFEDEVKVYKRLHAGNDPDIGKNRIPKVYYHGPILGSYFAIAMTFFEENLFTRFETEKHNLSEPTILLIFKDTVEALRYIHSKGVSHKDVNGCNIFLSGQDVFLADFASSTLDERVWHLSDYNALLFTIWDMVGVPAMKNRGLNTNVADKLAHLKNPYVREAFQTILNIKTIRIEYDFLPNYDEIIRAADDGLAKIGEKLGEQVQFEWLKKRKNPSSGESSGQRKRSK